MIMGAGAIVLAVLAAGSGSISIAWDNIFIGLTSVVIAALSFIAGSRALQISRRSELLKQQTAKETVDAGAYVRAQAIYESSLKQLEYHNALLQAEIDRLNAEIRALRQAAPGRNPPQGRGRPG
jgi:uncharacterized small protein (DUF1192 family)